jgi:hypothetical protein
MVQFEPNPRRLILHLSCSPNRCRFHFRLSCHKRRKAPLQGDAADSKLTMAG